MITSCLVYSSVVIFGQSLSERYRLAMDENTHVCGKVVCRFGDGGVCTPTNGRALLIGRTERGREVNRVARQVLEEIQPEWSEALGQERFSALLDALRQLVAVLDEPIGAANDREWRMAAK